MINFALACVHWKESPNGTTEQLNTGSLPSVLCCLVAHLLKSRISRRLAGVDMTEGRRSLCSHCCR
ncbi:hypothetical protein E2C01_080801 [Portunus trituberculatus]|uniref:Uncharacterized protein n=1 Tax=Portunus trituberculatus TaxID=210409 RepID=A0A5B7IQB1_PORTR|nr:hypothetical protein [Portunus trituberculatus]